MQQYFQKMQNRCQISPDTRPLKRHQRRESSRQSGGVDKGIVGTALYPDVYPQQEKQEEDNLNPDRLIRGYQIEIVHSSLIRHEYDSLIKSSRIFMSDDQFYRTARWIKQIMQKKSELNTIWLDKNWIKENNVRGFISDVFRVEFFDSLLSGRRIQLKDNKRHSLAACFPRFLRAPYDQLISLAQQKTVPLCEAMNLLYEKGLPIQKAIWFLKMNQIAHPILVTSSKQKKGTSVSSDDYASDQRQFFIRYMRCLLKEYDKAIPGQLEQNSYYQRWPYFSALIKHSFEDGMLDRHEFLMDMCDLLAEFSNYSIEQPQTFRILIILMTQFIDLITQNVFIARRISYILCNRLAQYKRDYEKMKSIPTSTNICFLENLINCQHHRPTLMIIFGFLHAIIVDCPASLIWIPFKPADLLEGSQKSSKQLRAIEKENALHSVSWICGSPLDQLPCSATTEHMAKPIKDQINKFMDVRIQEIRERSFSVENHWSHINPSNEQSGIESIVENCLDILSMLDTIPLDQPNALKNLFENIFSYETEESDTNSQMNIEIKIRMLINWAVTFQRKGAHRALIVTKLLKMLSEDQESFGSAFKTIHELLLSCLYLDWVHLFQEEHNSKNSNNNAHIEFANLMLLFYELQRFNLFNHDQYVRTINGAFYQEPLYQRMKTMKIQHPIEQILQKSTKISEQSLSMKPPESQMIISFIPTTPSITSSHSVLQQKPEDFAKLRNENFVDNHAFMENGTELSFHERFLLHLPIEQRETNRDICNQRSIVLYGITELREQARQELRKLAREICKIWKKMSVEITNPSPASPGRELRFRHRCTNEQIFDVINRFQSQTYYDQLIIVGWCAESFIDIIEEFVRCLRMQIGASANQILPPFPTYECLDILCEMMNSCLNIHSLVTFTAELLPFLVEIEEIFHRKNQDCYINCIPGSLTAQLAYVLISQLAEHFYYFLYSPEACSIFNNLYLLIKFDLHTTSTESNEPLKITGWTRAIAMFILHGRDKLLSAQLNIRERGNIIPVFDSLDELLVLLPATGIGSLSRNLSYKRFPLVDQLNIHQNSMHNLRFFPYDELKVRLQTMHNEHSKYSFVQDAFKAACSCGHDYERLVELANFCAHISAQLRLETEWCNAIQELCYSNVSSNNNWNEMLLDIDGNNFSTHYPLSTFVLLLASKYAISSYALIQRLIYNVFNVVIREEGGLNNDNLEHGVCLAIYICASLICGTDIPFICIEITPKMENILNRRSDCNQNAIRIAHIAELGYIVFPLLTVIMQFVDELKRKVDASKKDPTSMRRFSQQMAIARCALLSMCEQEWVIQQMFDLCVGDQEMENFINSTRLRNHCLGQQLLRISLRRKSERMVKQELMECTDKTIYEKLLSALSIWNMRATYFDFKLIINETFPESQTSKFGTGNHQLSHHYQMTMFLFNNIGTACHQLFLSRLANKEHKDDDDKEEMSSKNFRPSSINCFWLIAPLVSAMPSPPPPITQMSSQNSHWCSWTTSAMKAHFLKVVSENLKTMPDAKNKSQESSEHSKYEQLLAYQPFLNLVMTCTEGENVKQLLDTLLDYIDDIVNRVRKNPIIPHQSNFMPEREGLVLRLNLLTGLFDHLATNANAESWASVLYQLLLFEVFTNEDTDYFDTCLDMLIILCHKMYPQRTYATFAGKFKNYRVPDDLYCLQQLLPIPKSQAELTAWDTFSNSIRTTAPQTNVGGKGSSAEQNQNLQMAKPQVMPMAKPQIQGIIVDKQFESIEKKILRMLKHDHWIQRNTDSNGKISLSFILRSGLPGEDKIRPDPFLSPPEMEQVSIIQEIGEEQSEKILQEMDKQQKYQQTLAPQRQQQSIIEQQNHQMRTYQQQMLQQQMMAAGGGHPIAGLGEPTSSSSGHAGQMPPSFSNQSPFLNLIQQQTGATHGSGSSTPVTTDSPVRTGAGRGGRRKSQAGSNQAAVGTVAGAGTGRGQKRRKETTKHQTPQMMGGNGGIEMFSINPQGGNGLPGTTTGIMGGAGPGGQMAMSHTPMMMQQQMQAQIWQQQQMQRQGPAPQQPMGMGGPMMYNQQQPSAQQASQQFRQQPPPQYQPPQQQAPGPGRPNVQYGGNQMPQMPMGMVGPGQVMQGIGTQPPPQMSDVKKQINAKLMQKQQHKQAQQQQQQQHPGMGGMGMPPGP